ncbi:MAG TPA: DUF2177 family protein [Vicinamibacterales bacterium]|nr:DUF2177 family protein [Vicinamibacterales bacterium]
MSMSALVKVYGLMTVTFFAIDLVWLGIVAKPFYQSYLGPMLRPDVRWGAAILFYLLFIAGILVFAVLPGVERASLRRAVALGAFFGLVAYATFDLTSLALVKGFPDIVAVVDMAWGTVLSASVAAAGYAAARWVGAGS